MKTHNYVKPDKFKNSNCGYALVRGIVFSSIYEAESYCTAHKLDVNTEIESDNPLVLAKCKQIAATTLPMLRLLQEQFRDKYDNLQKEYSIKNKARNEAETQGDMRLSLYQSYVTESIGKIDGFFHGMGLIDTYINTLENVLLLKG
jgi:hypothetical protein